jgi:cell division septum initiation protein DivIVA
MDDLRHRVDGLEKRVGTAEVAIAELRAEANARAEMLAEVRDTVHRIADRETREFEAAQKYRERVLGVAESSIGGLLQAIAAYLTSTLGGVALLLVALAILGRTVGVVWEVTYGDLAVRPVDSP